MIVFSLHNVRCDARLTATELNFELVLFINWCLRNFDLPRAGDSEQFGIWYTLPFNVNSRFYCF